MVPEFTFDTYYSFQVGYNVPFLIFEGAYLKLQIAKESSKISISLTIQIVMKIFAWKFGKDS